VASVMCRANYKVELLQSQDQVVCRIHDW